jgi:hypothetical protein
VLPNCPTFHTRVYLPRQSPFLPSFLPSFLPPSIGLCPSKQAPRFVVVGCCRHDTWRRRRRPPRKPSKDGRRWRRRLTTHSLHGCLHVKAVAREAANGKLLLLLHCKLHDTESSNDKRFWQLVHAAVQGAKWGRTRKTLTNVINEKTIYIISVWTRV